MTRQRPASHAGHRLVLLAAAMCALLAMPAVRADILGSSTLQKCVNVATGNEGAELPPAAADALECNDMLLVNMRLEQSEEAAESFTNNIAGGNIVDENGDSQTLESQLTVELTMPRLAVRFPTVALEGTNEVNNRPREITLLRDSNGADFGLLNPCVDTNNPSADVSCGFVRDAEGNAELGTQGRCCACSACQVTGIADCDLQRGASLCDIFSGSSSAHCMRMDPLWHTVYEVLAPQWEFIINVRVSKCDATGDNCEEGTLALSSDVPLGCIAIGDKPCAVMLKAYGVDSLVSPPSIDDQFLLVPTRCDEATAACEERLLESADHWLLIRGDQMERSGTVCNKVGTSYQALRTRNREDFCGGQVGDCTESGSPQDLYEQSLAEEADGGVPTYFPTRHLAGRFEGDALSSAPRLAYLWDAAASVQVTMWMDAGELTFTRNSSPAEITNVDIRDFEAKSDDGRVIVEVTNQGGLAGQYSVTVSDCSAGIERVPSKNVNLPPSISKDVTFPLRADVIEGRNYACDITVTDQEGKQWDRVTIRFNTTDLEFDRGAAAGSLEEDAPITDQFEGLIKLSCRQYCPRALDLPCAIVHGCVEGLLALVLIVLLCCCCCCCCAKSKKCFPLAACLVKSACCCLMKIPAVLMWYESGGRKKRRKKGRKGRKRGKDGKRRKKGGKRRKDGKRKRKHKGRKGKRKGKRSKKSKPAFYDPEIGSSSAGDHAGYFNVQNADASGPEGYGVNFSVRGMVRRVGSGYQFYVPADMARQVRAFNGVDYVAVPPRAMDAAFFTSDLDENEMFFYVSAAPRYACINE